MAGTGAAHVRGPAQHLMADSGRRTDPVGLTRAIQSEPVVVALAELDARFVARAAGPSDVSDDTRSVSLGWSYACSWWRIARIARHCGIRSDLSTAVKLRFQSLQGQRSSATFLLPVLPSCMGYNPRHRQPLPLVELRPGLPRSFREKIKENVRAERIQGIRHAWQCR